MSFRFSPKIITDGLILYYDPYNIKSYNNGTLVNDLSKSEVNSTLVNGVSHDGKSFVFDGINDYILINNSTELYTIQYNMTIMGWFNDNGSRTTPTIFGQYLNTTPGNLIKLVRAQSGSFVYFSSSNASPGYQVFVISNAYSYNKWNFFSITVDGNITSSTIKIRVNNLNQTFTANQMANPNTNVKIRIGSSENTFQSSNEYFAGRISNILLYNKVLNEDEIQQNYNTTKSRFGL